MKESIFSSSLRSLLASFFCVLGIFLAFIPVILFFNLIESDDDAISTEYSVKILPNAEGLRKKEGKTVPVILQINVHGVIGTDNLTENHMRELLVESREGTLKEGRVKAILLHCNTPGGGMVDADGIYRALKEYKERYKVPVFAYVDGLLASGGMYVAAAADEIHTNDISLIGSIGVITTGIFNVSNLMDKIGVESLTLYAGKGKDDLNPFRPWKAGESDNYRSIIDYYYQSFVDLIVSSRPRLNRNLLVDKLGADIFPAEQALEYGLVDVVHANRDSTLKKLLTKIGIEDSNYQVVELSSGNWISHLFRSENSLLKGTLKHQISLNNELPAALSNQPLYLYRP
ncbi:putative signal peptide peptidase SppA [Chlamydiales bacterium STE3]|nr:putative signal peptide peptidase SppA [Chlamydiales bacterium STE3]